MKVFKIILFTGVLSLVIVELLLVYYRQGNHDAKNDFFRYFPQGMLKNINTRDIAAPSYYLAGLSSTRIFLGSYISRKQAYFMDYGLSGKESIPLHYPKEKRIAWKSLHLRIDSPDVYLTDRRTPSLMRFDLNGELSSYHNWNVRLSFDRCIPVSPVSSITRAYDTGLNQQILKKISKGQKSTHRYILKKQIDGYFCVDGMLHYSREQANIVYIYYYRNQILRLDTNLNLQYKTSTIDPVSNAQITVRTIARSSAGEEKIMASPPLLLNRLSAVSGKRIFICSARKADNENARDFNHSDVIDVYSLREGKYLFSFYLPKVNGESLTDFMIRDRNLVALSGRYISTYRLEF